MLRIVHVQQDLPNAINVVPAGIPIDGKTVFTSDHALKLEWLPNWIAIIGSGYIGLEFSDVYTALGCEVTFIEVGRVCIWAAVGQVALRQVAGLLHEPLELIS